MSYAWEVTIWTGDVEGAEHDVEAVGQLPQQYARSTRLQSFLRGFTEQLQSLEEVGQDLLAKRSVYTAEGDQLDILGDIVDLSRGALTDSEYRTFLLGKVFANLADGQIPQINELLADILGYSSVEVREYWPAALSIYAAEVDHPDVVNRLLALLVGAGIQYGFQFNAVTSADTFTFSSVLNAEQTDASQGMGALSTEAGPGGALSGHRGRISL